MDIFKLIYEHDIRLDSLRERHTGREEPDITFSLEAFMKPDPTFSKFYFTGTRLKDELFGLNRLTAWPRLLSALSDTLGPYRIITEEGETGSLEKALESMQPGDAIVLTKHGSTESSPSELGIDSGSNAGHRKEPLRKALLADELVLYKEQAHHGFDLHLFSGANIYRTFFYPLQQLVSDEFRFFSMNGKRVQSERQFYFETWTLDRPPHGTEEVFPETVL